MKQPNKDESALMQARSMYNNAKIEKVIYGDGYTVGSDDLIIKVNRMSWGLFEATILKAYKENEYLRNYNPELVENDKECSACKGIGKFPFEIGSKEYDEQLADWNGDMKEDDYFYLKRGEPLAKFCSPCQGTGIVLKVQP